MFDKLKQRVDNLNSEATTEDLVVMYSEVDDWYKKLKEIRSTIASKLHDRLVEVGPYTINDVVFSPTSDKEYKANLKPAQMASELIDIFGNKAVFDLLASGAFKYGALKKLLIGAGREAEFTKYYTVVPKPGVKSVNKQPLNYQIGEDEE